MTKHLSLLAKILKIKTLNCAANMQGLKLTSVQRTVQQLQLNLWIKL